MFDPDEIAGIVDLFGALERSELERAIGEVAFRRGADLDDETRSALIDDALDAYGLVAVDDDERMLLVPGPAAFPTLPEGGEDLPHIMEIEHRSIDRERIGESAAERLREETQHVSPTDEDRRERLLDLSYEIESWAPVSLSGVREQLDGE